MTASNNSAPPSKTGLKTPYEIPFEPGTVWLAGAGPGDPGLLTLHAVNALQAADVVVYDALVNQQILALARPDARLIYAGKRGGRPSLKQQDISLQLVELARAGHRVLRLKGGDPFVFGRGAEEALALAKAGIAFRIIPGITAGIGGLAYAGIPATHRTVNTAVTFVTGHTMQGDQDHINWDALAKASPVIVFYMALKQLTEIAQRLMAAGRSGKEPVAIVSKAATADQQTVISDLANCGAAVARARLPAPVIVVIGEVVALQEQLAWFNPAEMTDGDTDSPVFEHADMSTVLPRP